MFMFAPGSVDAVPGIFVRMEDGEWKTDYALRGLYEKNVAKDLVQLKISGVFRVF